MQATQRKEITEVFAMAPRMRDAEIAIILEWQDDLQVISNFSTDANDDLRVLKYARENWKHGKDSPIESTVDQRIYTFCLCLRDLFLSRPSVAKYMFNQGDLPVYYEVGDYTIATLATVRIMAERETVKEEK